MMKNLEISIEANLFLTKTILENHSTITNLHKFRSNTV